MFKDKDIICFLGDSITATGLWMAEVYQELRKKYLIKCYNCAVAGATMTCALEYLQSECLRYNPDYVCIMFGVNDINRSLYVETPEDTIERKSQLVAQRKVAIQQCIEAYEKAVNSIKEAGATAIICIPVPYDEISISSKKNMKCQCGLSELAELLRNLAKKYDCPIVDFQATMCSMLGKRAIISEDRVHPTVEGQHVMAQIFLREMGEIENVDFDTTFEIEAWNRQRLEAEQKLLWTNWAEYCLFYSERLRKATYEEKKSMAKKKLDNLDCCDNVGANAYIEYIERIDIRDQLIGEVVRLTIF